MELNSIFIKCILKLPNCERIFIKFILKLGNCNWVFSYTWLDFQFHVTALNTSVTQNAKLFPLHQQKKLLC